MKYDEAESSWPEHFPQGCPPTEAVDANGSLFRVAAVPPSEPDSRSALEDGLFLKSPPCVRAALSCWTTHERAQELLALPRHRAKAVIELRLRSDHGVMAPTGGPGHVSLWLRAKHLASLKNYKGSTRAWPDDATEAAS